MQKVFFDRRNVELELVINMFAEEKMQTFVGHIPYWKEFVNEKMWLRFDDLKFPMLSELFFFVYV